MMAMEIRIYNHKIFQVSIPHKVTSENDADKGKLPVHGADSREAVGHQPLIATVGPTQEGVSSVSSSRQSSSKLSL